MTPTRAMAVSAMALLSLKSYAAAAAYPRVEEITKPVTRLAFGSCNDQSMEQPLWKDIIDYAPEMWLWMGDNVRASLSVCNATAQWPDVSLCRSTRT